MPGIEEDRKPCACACGGWDGFVQERGLRESCHSVCILILSLAPYGQAGAGNLQPPTARERREESKGE